MEIKDIEKLAELAKIELNSDEKEKLLKDMDGILDYVKQIKEVEVEDMEPEYEHRNIWREDLSVGEGEKIDSIFSRDLIISQFPDSQDGFVKVKKIL